MKTPRQTPELECRCIGSQDRLSKMLCSCQSLSLSKHCCCPTRQKEIREQMLFCSVTSFSDCLCSETVCAANLCAVIQSAVLIVHGNRSYHKCNSPGNWNSDCTGIGCVFQQHSKHDLRNTSLANEQTRSSGNIGVCYNDEDGHNQVQRILSAPFSDL
jgi:hypothetical protein